MENPLLKISNIAYYQSGVVIMIPMTHKNNESCYGSFTLWRKSTLLLWHELGGEWPTEWLGNYCHKNCLVMSTIVINIFGTFIFIAVSFSCSTFYFKYCFFGESIVEAYSILWTMQTCFYYDSFFSSAFWSPLFVSCSFF